MGMPESDAQSAAASAFLTLCSPATDSVTSPIAQPADQRLIAESDMASFVDSLAAPLSIINAIIVAVARAKQDELTVRLRRLEEIWDEYDVYDKTHG